jgi:hypothetical protein
MVIIKEYEDLDIVKFRKLYDEDGEEEEDYFYC